MGHRGTRTRGPPIPSAKVWKVHLIGGGPPGSDRNRPRSVRGGNRNVQMHPRGSRFPGKKRVGRSVGSEILARVRRATNLTSTCTMANATRRRQIASTRASCAASTRVGSSSSWRNGRSRKRASIERSLEDNERKASKKRKQEVSPARPRDRMEGIGIDPWNLGSGRMEGWDRCG